MRNCIFKIMYGMQLPYLLRTLLVKNRRSIVLCLHRVSDEDDIMFPPLKTNQFILLLDYLVKHFKIVPIAEIFNREKNKKPLLAITFDDGYKDFIRHALPELIKRNLHSNHNVVIDALDNKKIIWTQRLNNVINVIRKTKAPQRIELDREQFIINDDQRTTFFEGLRLFKKLLSKSVDERQPFINKLENDYLNNNPNELMMSWEDVKYCLANKVNIGSHSYSHDALSTIEDINILKKEICDSKQCIEEKLGSKVNVIAFPNGEYNSKVVEVSRNAGYEFLLTAQEKFVKQPDDIIHRISIAHNKFEENIMKVHNFHNLIRFQ